LIPCLHLSGLKVAVHDEILAFHRSYGPCLTHHAIRMMHKLMFKTALFSSQPLRHPLASSLVQSWYPSLHHPGVEVQDGLGRKDHQVASPSPLNMPCQGPFGDYESVNATSPALYGFVVSIGAGTLFVKTTADVLVGGYFLLCLRTRILSYSVP
jgi:hypothetical protein